jgi:opacity protein-like surface antigen
MLRGILGAMLATTLLVGFAVPANADEVVAEAIIVGTEAPAPAPVMQEAKPDKSGPFIGIGISHFSARFDPLAVTLEGPAAGLYESDFDNTWGFNLRGGYRFCDYLAAEGVLEYADSYTSEVSYPALGVPGELNTTQDTLWTIDFALNVKAILPLGRFEPYLSGGVGFMYGNQLQITDAWERNEAGALVEKRLSKSNDPVVFMGRVAGGVDFALTDTFGLFAEAAYLMPTSSLSEFDAIAVNFGGRLTF